MITLLNLDDIAKLYRVSRRHARDTLVKQPGFPEPVPGCSVKVPLWDEGQILAYIRKKPAPIPQTEPQAA